MRGTLAMLGLVAVMGCGGDGPAEPVEPDRTFTLTTLVGQGGPPYVIEAEGGLSLALMNAEITLRGDGTFRDIRTYRLSSAAGTTTRQDTSTGRRVGVSSTGKF